MKTLRALAFTYRSYTPIPFLILMVFTAQPTLASLMVGFCVLCVGELIRFWGVSIAGAETRTTGTVGGTYLITSGPFAHVRNPLYLGNMLMYTGIGIMSMALFPWLQIVALVWFAVQYRLIVAGEEEYLAGRFGAEYEEYRRQVPRFLPRLTRYVPSAAPAKALNPSEGLASEKRTLQAVGIVTLMLVIIYIVQQG